MRADALRLLTVVTHAPDDLEDRLEKISPRDRGRAQVGYIGGFGRQMMAQAANN